MADANVYTEAAEKIIREQRNIVGPLAVEQAEQVEGLKLDGERVSLSGNQMDTLERLVEVYRELFGQTSVEVCKDATRSVFSRLHKEEVPQLLR